jgi:hypothetical protein
MIDWTAVVVNAGITAVVIGTASVLGSMKRGVSDATIVDSHGKRLNDHDELHKQTAARFEALRDEFVPRRELEAEMRSIREGLQASQTYLRYLCFREVPKPPEMPRESP